MEFTQEAKDLISAGLYTTIVDFINSREPVTVLFDNHNDWQFPLPANLQKAKRFTLDIHNQTLEDTYVEDGKIILNTRFGEDENSKVIMPCDIAAIIGSDGQTPIFYKPFIELPELVIKTKEANKFEVPSDEELMESMFNFQKYNPELFEKMGF